MAVITIEQLIALALMLLQASAERLAPTNYFGSQLVAKVKGVVYGYPECTNNSDCKDFPLNTCEATAGLNLGHCKRTCLDVKCAGNQVCIPMDQLSPDGKFYMCGCTKTNHCGIDEVCNDETNECVPPCELTQCDSKAPKCVDIGRQSKCVCTENDECPANYKCDSELLQCVDPCSTIKCPKMQPVCTVEGTYARCSCRLDEHCGDGYLCNPSGVCKKEVYQKSDYDFQVQSESESPKNSSRKVFPGPVSKVDKLKVVSQALKPYEIQNQESALDNRGSLSEIKHNFQFMEQEIEADKLDTEQEGEKQAADKLANVAPGE